MRRLYDEEREEATARLRARHAEVADTLEGMGICPDAHALSSEDLNTVLLDIDALEQVARVIRWAQSRGMKHMDQFS